MCSFTTMRCINRHFTYLLTYLHVAKINFDVRKFHCYGTDLHDAGTHVHQDIATITVNQSINQFI